METSKDLRLAVLIDADNISSTYVKEMLVEIAKYGTPTFKRIYADWTKPTVSGWKNVLLENAITPIQQYGYTTGKNSTDSAMIIDAMDILYSGRVDGFCLVTSDSDFTRLATRLREAGMKVIGLGYRKTPGSFISACEKFIYLEILKQQPEEKQPTNRKGARQQPAQRTETLNKVDDGLNRLIINSVKDIADEDGWAFLGDLGNLLLKKHPDFDPRNYGFEKLLPLIKSTHRFEVDERQGARSNTKLVYIKIR